MKPSQDSVEDFIDAIGHQKRRRDAETLLGLLREATGEEPRMWGSIVAPPNRLRPSTWSTG